MRAWRAYSAVEPEGEEQDGNDKKARLRRLSDPKTRRTKAQLVTCQIVAMAHHMVPGLEGISEIAGGEQGRVKASGAAFKLLALAG